MNEAWRVCWLHRIRAPCKQNLENLTCIWDHLSRYCSQIKVFPYSVPCFSRYGSVQLLYLYLPFVLWTLLLQSKWYCVLSWRLVSFNLWRRGGVWKFDLILASETISWEILASVLLLCTVQCTFLKYLFFLSLNKNSKYHIMPLFSRAENTRRINAIQFLIRKHFSSSKNNVSKETRDVWYKLCRYPIAFSDRVERRMPRCLLSGPIHCGSSNYVRQTFQLFQRNHLYTKGPTKVWGFTRKNSGFEREIVIITLTPMKIQKKRQV